MASGSESHSSGSKIKGSTAAKGRLSSYAGAWNPNMDTPF